MENTFVARPAGGRVVTIGRQVGLADVRPDATVRLDAIARFLQDVADHDAATADLDGGLWVLRRLALRVDRTPRFRAELTCSTWCSGVGARWAERRTDLVFGELPCVQAAGVWVHVDRQTGAPRPLPPGFDDLWGVSADGRRVRANLRHPPPPAGVDASAWPLRATDFDVVDHVNNAAYWAPVEDELARRGGPRVTAAEIEFRDGVYRDDPVEIVTDDRPDGFATWWCVRGDVRASALVACAS
ncbi:MAG: acyl-ACP thioesterase domain-containing protein [Acidimicrobiia bacterium]